MGVPYFSVSIALSWQGKVVAGVVYNPLLDELYAAEQGGGAQLNGAAIRAAGPIDLQSALVASAYAVDEQGISEGVRTLRALSLAARKVTVHFSPALDLCNIARGRIHGYWDAGTTPEDHAAASLILAEGGGVVRNYDGGPWQPDLPGIAAAANEALHAQLLACAGGSGAR